MRTARPRATNPTPTVRRSRAGRGSAVLVVLVLLACLALFLTANSRALHTLKQELKLIEQRQMQKFEAGAAPP